MMMYMKWQGFGEMEKDLEFEHFDEVYSKIWFHLEDCCLTIQCRNIENGKQEDGVFILFEKQVDELIMMLTCGQSNNWNDAIEAAAQCVNHELGDDIDECYYVERAIRKLKR